MALIPLMRGSALVPEVRTGFTDAARGYLTGRQAAQNRELTSQRLQDLAEDRASRAEDRALTRQYRQEAAKLGPDATIQDRLSLATRFGPPGAALNAAATVERLKLAQAADARAARASGVAAGERQRLLNQRARLEAAYIEAGIDPVFAGTELGREMYKRKTGLTDPVKPSTKVGEIRRDVEKGLITPEEGASMIATETGQLTPKQIETKRRQAGALARPITDAANLISSSATATGPLSTAVGWISGSAKRDLEALLEEVRGTMAFRNVDDLRKSGVDLGRLSDADLRLAGNITAALDANLSAPRLLNNLRRIWNLNREIDPSIGEFPEPEQAAPANPGDAMPITGLRPGERRQVGGAIIERMD